MPIGDKQMESTAGLHAGSCSTTSLLDLPVEVLESIYRLLPPIKVLRWKGSNTDRLAFAATCRAFAAASQAAPEAVGLQCKLPGTLRRLAEWASTRRLEQLGLNFGHLGVEPGLFGPTFLVDDPLVRDLPTSFAALAKLSRLTSLSLMVLEPLDWASLGQVARHLKRLVLFIPAPSNHNEEDEEENENLDLGAVVGNCVGSVCEAAGALVPSLGKLQDLELTPTGCYSCLTEWRFPQPQTWVQALTGLTRLQCPPFCLGEGEFLKQCVHLRTLEVASERDLNSERMHIWDNPGYRLDLAVVGKADALQKVVLDEVYLRGSLESLATVKEVELIGCVFEVANNHEMKRILVKRFMERKPGVDKDKGYVIEGGQDWGTNNLQGLSKVTSLLFTVPNMGEARAQAETDAYFPWGIQFLTGLRRLSVENIGTVWVEVTQDWLWPHLSCLVSLEELSLGLPEKESKRLLAIYSLPKLRKLTVFRGADQWPSEITSATERTVHTFLRNRGVQVTVVECRGETKEAFTSAGPYQGRVPCTKTIWVQDNYRMW